MIVSGGLTPAWQQILVFDGFQYGRVNRAAEVHWCTAGKVFNAGIAAHHLGGPSMTVAPLGGPPFGRIQAELNELGVPHRLLRTEAATRVCTTILDRATGTVTELVENGRPLTPQELDRFLEVYREEAAKADVAMIIGSLPVGTAASVYRQLVERTPCPAILDLRGDGLLSTLDLEPLVVKPNRDELARTVGRPLETDDELVAAMRSLNGRGAQWVVITQGGGPVWVSSRTALYRLHPPQLEKVVNPIACGDAMAAGIAWAVRDGRPMVDAVQFGIGASLDNLQQLLLCRLDRERVERGAELVRVEPA